MFIIGITGRKRHGKDTVADFLIQEYGFTKVSLGTPIKDVCRIAFNLGDEHLYGDLKDEVNPEWGVTNRLIMQEVGEKLLEIHSDVWVSAMIRTAKEKKLNRVVLPDVRRPATVSRIKMMRGQIWKVERPGMLDADTHITESGVDDIIPDRQIKNDGSLENLYQRITSVMKDLNPPAC